VAQEEDYNQIFKLRARYFRFLDTKQWEDFRGLFTDDLDVVIEGAVLAGGGARDHVSRWSGGDAFAAHVRNLVGGALTVHHGHMHEIDIVSPTEARGVCAMEDIVEYPDGRTLNGQGHYHDVYRRTPDGWRIAAFRITRLRIKTTGM
jgi:hypothetical protein